MITEYSLRRSNEMIKMQSLIKNEEHYLKTRKNRNELASIFKQMMNCGASFPPRPLSMNSHLPNQLQKRISNTCPYCVKSSQMRKYIKQAIALINQYVDILRTWLDENDFEDLPNDVHKLEPTKK